MALVGIGWYTPYHGKCTTSDGSLVTGDPVPSLGACRALPAVWSMSEDAPGCSDGVSSNATECREALHAPPSGWTNGLNWETPLWCDIVVFIAPVACTSLSPACFACLRRCHTSDCVHGTLLVHACFGAWMQTERATCLIAGSGVISRNRLASLSKVPCRARCSRSHYLRPRSRASCLTSAFPSSSPILSSEQLGRRFRGGSFLCQRCAFCWLNGTRTMRSPRRQCRHTTACSKCLTLHRDLRKHPLHVEAAEASWRKSYFTVRPRHVIIILLTSNKYRVTSRTGRCDPNNSEPHLRP